MNGWRTWWSCNRFPVPVHPVYSVHSIYSRSSLRQSEGEKKKKRKKCVHEKDMITHCKIIALTIITDDDDNDDGEVRWSEMRWREANSRHIYASHEVTRWMDKMEWRKEGKQQPMHMKLLTNYNYDDDDDDDLRRRWENGFIRYGEWGKKRRRRNAFKWIWSAYFLSSCYSFFFSYSLSFSSFVTQITTQISLLKEWVNEWINEWIMKGNIPPPARQLVNRSWCKNEFIQNVVHYKNKIMHKWSRH